MFFRGENTAELKLQLLIYPYLHYDMKILYYNNSKTYNIYRIFITSLV